MRVVTKSWSLKSLFTLKVTVDTVEDVESHSDDCDDDIKQIGESYERPQEGACKIPVSKCSDRGDALFYY